MLIESIVILQILVLLYLIFGIIWAPTTNKKRQPITYSNGYSVYDPRAPLNGFWRTKHASLEIVHIGFYHVLVNDGYQTREYDFNPDKGVLTERGSGEILLWDGYHRLVDPQNILIFVRQGSRSPNNQDQWLSGLWTSPAGDMLDLNVVDYILQGRLGELDFVGIGNQLFSRSGVLGATITKSGILVLSDPQGHHLEFTKLG